ncbi:hypothetical protein Moror_3289 [Moniliophthora roreri MCA 2997]|uniref:Reverse transcriptase-rnase h-integrase n=2 Tax=Moniliophthora roreri TaxID=221103 RepID=V2XV08_MONRO|nr:hypothetical protein Moror_3289 [Moniliophthora roreri MCA 2997]
MPPRTESQIERDIAEAEEHRCGLQTQSISNPGGRAIPPLTWASCKELLTALLLPSLMSLPPTETPREDSETRRTSTPSSIITGLEENRSEEATPPITLKGFEPDTFTTSLTSAEDLDPFQHLLHTLKNSPRSAKQPQLEEMSEDKKPLESRPKVEAAAEEAVISATVPVQIVLAEKEVKAVLPRAFTGH